MAKVLVVYAHPEHRSLNGALKNVILEELEARGHDVELSDLYAMNWKASADAADFENLDDADRLHVPAASRAAFQAGAQAADVAAEQRKLTRADAVVFQFPIWWSAPPAIFKGWIDRVFVNGFGYGLGSYEGPPRARRYGEGTLEGKRALVSVTGGGQPMHYSARSIKGGTATEVLWPFLHGLLWYTGAQVLEPVALLAAERVSEARFAEHASVLRARLGTMMTDQPIAFRGGNSGDYDDDLCLKEGLEGSATGLAMHLRTRAQSGN